MRLKNQSIKDFGSQWKLYKDNQGYHSSLDLFSDIIKPYFTIDDFEDKIVAEVGSGNGRIIGMLSKTKAASIYAIEPSIGYKVIKDKFHNDSQRIKVINKAGDEFIIEEKLDFILSIGVIHHIHQPDPVLLNCRNNLKDNGKILIWLYGREGNYIYLFLITLLRTFTPFIPDYLLKILVDIIYLPLTLYIKLSSHIKLPMRGYMLNVIGRMDPESQKQIIFDQLNPIYSKYYKEREVFNLLNKNGFKNIKIHRRQGYSYTATATKN